jgi:hypothetical protein
MRVRLVLDITESTLAYLPAQLAGIIRHGDPPSIEFEAESMAAARRMLAELERESPNPFYGGTMRWRLEAVDDQKEAPK